MKERDPQLSGDRLHILYGMQKGEAIPHLFFGKDRFSGTLSTRFAIFGLKSNCLISVPKSSVWAWDVLGESGRGTRHFSHTLFREQAPDYAESDGDKSRSIFCYRVGRNNGDAIIGILD